MRFRPAIACVLLLPLCGCTIFGGPKDRALRKTPSYQAGYSDGCAAGDARSSNYRSDPATDKQMYDTDPIYRRGWANGYQACQPPPQAPGDDPLHNQGLNHHP